VEGPDNPLLGYGCPPDFYCIGLRLIEPGQELDGGLLPTESQYIHELPGRCFVEGFSVSCYTTQQLTAGDYSVEARAYTALTCGDVSCDCNNADGSDTCVGYPAPRGAGQAFTATSTFEFGGAMSLRGVTLTFTE